MLAGADRLRANRRRVLTQGLVIGGAAAVGSLPGRALAQETAEGRLKTVLDRGRVIVGTGSSTPPWHFEDEAGQLVGMDVEMGHILANGLFGDRDKVEFVQQAADARVPNLMTDKVDITIQFMSVTVDRARMVDFTLPYYREALTLLFVKDSPFTSLADVQGKGVKVAALQNVYIEDLVKEKIPDAEVLQFDSIANTILALESRRVDTTFADFSTAGWVTAQDPGKFKIAEETWGNHNYAAAVRPGDQRWINFVNEIFLSAMAGLDFAPFHDAYLKYLGIDVPLAPAGFPTQFL
ncbi:MAG: transporter substrate-binding domain-containing protein [Thermomicrobiales bacterium]|nr:transporter substrate-binding domain-containing protein [Thermomicrobiales bacterium]